MTDSSEIGRYGTLRLLKRHNPETTVAFFPIDDETVTFGRSKQCSVRLYYDCVSELHCTLQFSEERKAFLIVQGTNGLLVDGCQVYPSRSPGSGPTTVPLTNGSEIEIYKKRFKFEYPPKDIRAALLATPRNAKARRSLRMSMIKSAQVFTPRGIPDAVPRTPQRGNNGQGRGWEALRTPIKVPSHDGGADQEMTLLEGGDDAFVVEEDKDLIILERVDDRPQDEPAAPSHSNPEVGRSVAFSVPTATPPARPVLVPQSAHAPQHTPHITLANRRRSAPSLHRAVVLRSAHRALQREQERFEEQQEEDEVEAEVSPERELGPFELKTEDTEEEEDSWRYENYPNQDEEHDEASEPYPLIDTRKAPPARPPRRMSAFRASLDAMRKVIPLPFNWKPPEEIPLPDEDDGQDEGKDGGEERGLDVEHQDVRDDDTLEDEQKPIFHTPIRRHLGPFMTPQVQFKRPAEHVPVDVTAPASIGGEGAAQNMLGGAQRVRVVPAWKITDIVLPEPEKSAIGEEQKPKERISEEERRAIMARRKSALHTPSSLPAPGPRASAFPPSIQSDVYTPGEDEDADTMLERMRHKMANLRRKSEARKARMSLGIRQQSEESSLLVLGTDRRDRGLPDARIVEETLTQTKRADLHPKTAGLSSHMQDQDDLDLLQTPTDEDDRQHVAGATPGLKAPSLTLRYDGVREMFRQPHVEPKTPSFTGFKAMFEQRSEVVVNTPSFRGVKQMFNRAGSTTLATPRMDLGEIFDEDDESDDLATDIMEERETTNYEGVTNSEDETSVAATPSLKTSTRTRKVATSTSKRSSRKKEAPPVDVPSAVVEEGREDENDDMDEVESMPAPTVRRVARRSAKNITPSTGGAPPSGESSGRGTSRTTRKAAEASQGTAKGIVVHRTTKTRRLVDDDSEDEEPNKTTKSGGRGKRKIKQVSEAEVEPEPVEPEPVVKSKAGSRKTKAAEASDSENAVAPKPRRARVIKTAQVEPIETTSAPTNTKGARRIKIEESPDAGDPTLVNKAPKSKRGAKTKVTESADELPLRNDDYSSESEDVTPATTKGKVAKKGWSRKTPVVTDNVSDDKENSGEQSKLLEKTPAVRTRRAAATPVDASDAPAKRTRSRK